MKAREAKDLVTKKELAVIEKLYANVPSEWAGLQDWQIRKNRAGFLSRLNPAICPEFKSLIDKGIIHRALCRADKQKVTSEWCLTRKGLAVFFSAVNGISRRWEDKDESNAS